MTIALKYDFMTQTKKVIRMPLNNTLERYGSVAQGFHWVIALLIISLIGVGLYMTTLEGLTPQRLQMYGLHKSFGITVLILAALRLGWRFMNVTPRLPVDFKRTEKFAAHASHILLYLCMFLMPLTGWGMTSAAGFPVSFFGLFTLPDLVAPNNDLRIAFKLIHEYSAYGLIALICVHGGAALWHHFIRKDNILRRMLPGGKNV